MDKKPQPKDFGYEEPSVYDEGGWMLEGGEEAFNEAMKEWNSLVEKGNQLHILYLEAESFSKEWEVKEYKDGNGVGIIVKDWVDYVYDDKGKHPIYIFVTLDVFGTTTLSDIEFAHYIVNLHNESLKNKKK